MFEGEMSMLKIIAQSLGAKFEEPKRKVHIDDLEPEDLMNMGFNVRRG